jgi:hypothetical protein
MLATSLLASALSFPPPLRSQAVHPDPLDAGAPSAAGQVASAPAQQQASPSGEEHQTEEMLTDSAEHDITLLKSRLVSRYDYKSQVGDTTANRLRLKGLWGFGSEGRIGLAVSMPVIDKEGPGS